MNILVTVEDARAFERKLAGMTTRAIPHAVRDALNELAFVARSEWVEVIGARFTLRNRFTERSLRVTKARGTKMDSMQSVVGSTADYMLDQEQGAKKGKRGKHGLAIPTPAAAGQSPKASKRTRQIRRGYYLGAMRVVDRVQGTQRAKNAAAIAMAKRTGGIAYLETERHKGLYRIMGSKKRPKPRMIYSLNESSVTIQPNKTLASALIEANARAPAISIAAMQRQIDRIFARAGT